MKSGHIDWIKLYFIKITDVYKDKILQEKLFNIDEGLIILDEKGNSVGYAIKPSIFNDLGKYVDNLEEKSSEAKIALSKPETTKYYYRSMFNFVWKSKRERFYVKKGDLFIGDINRPGIITHEDDRKKFEIPYKDYGVFFYELYSHRIIFEKERIDSDSLRFYNNGFSYFKIDFDIELTPHSSEFTPIRMNDFHPYEVYMGYEPFKHKVTDFVYYFYYNPKYRESAIKNSFDLKDPSFLKYDDYKGEFFVPNTLVAKFEPKKIVRKIINYSLNSEKELKVFFDDDTSEIYQIKDNLYKTLMSAAKENSG